MLTDEHYQVGLFFCGGGAEPFELYNTKGELLIRSAAWSAVIKKANNYLVEVRIKEPTQAQRDHANALIAGGYVTYQEPFTAKGLADMVRAVEEELKCL